MKTIHFIVKYIGFVFILAAFGLGVTDNIQSYKQDNILALSGKYIKDSKVARELEDDYRLTALIHDPQARELERIWIKAKENSLYEPKQSLSWSKWYKEKADVSFSYLILFMLFPMSLILYFLVEQEERNIKRKNKIKEENQKKVLNSTNTVNNAEELALTEQFLEK